MVSVEDVVAVVTILVAVEGRFIRIPVSRDATAAAAATTITKMTRRVKRAAAMITVRIVEDEEGVEAEVDTTL